MSAVAESQVAVVEFEIAQLRGYESVLPAVVLPVIAQSAVNSQQEDSPLNAYLGSSL